MAAEDHFVDAWIVTKSAVNWTDTVLGKIVAPSGI